MSLEQKLKLEKSRQALSEAISNYYEALDYKNISGLDDEELKENFVIKVLDYIENIKDREEFERQKALLEKNNSFRF